jgi:type II secretory pathway component PulJ
MHLATAGRALDRCRDHARNERTDRELAELERYAALLNRHLLRIAKREIRPSWPRYEC